MKKKAKYCQCTLERKPTTVPERQLSKGASLTIQTVTFLPEKFAKIGRVLDLKDEGTDQEWSRGWTVVSVGAVIDEPVDWRKAVRTHRQRTGDDKPKKSGSEN